MALFDHLPDESEAPEPTGLFDNLPDEPPPPSPPNPFLETVQRTGGQIASAAGTTLEDIGADETGRKVREYGEQVIAEHPSQLEGLGDIIEKPGTAIQEAVGNVLPQIPLSLGGAWAGAKAGASLPLPPQGRAIAALLGGGVGAFAPNLMMEYGETRAKQREEGIDDKGLAMQGALPAAGLEMLGDVGIAGRLLPDPLKKAVGKVVGESVLPEGAGLGARALYALKEGAKGAAIEGPLTEVPQTYLERFGGGQEMFTPEGNEEAALSGALGAIGGGALRGGGSFIAPARPEQVKPGTEETPPQAPPQPTQPTAPIDTPPTAPIASLTGPETARLPPPAGFEGRVANVTPEGVVTPGPGLGAQPALQRVDDLTRYADELERNGNPEAAMDLRARMLAGASTGNTVLDTILSRPGTAPLTQTGMASALDKMRGALQTPTPTAPEPPAPPPISDEALGAFAVNRLNELLARPPESLTGTERGELEFLQANLGVPQAIAAVYGQRIQQPTLPPTGDTHALQEQEPGAPHGGGGPQPGIRAGSANQPVQGQGMEPGGPEGGEPPQGLQAAGKGQAEGQGPTLEQPGQGEGPGPVGPQPTLPSSTQETSHGQSTEGQGQETGQGRQETLLEPPPTTLPGQPGGAAETEPAKPAKAPSTPEQKPEEGKDRKPITTPGTNLTWTNLGGWSVVGRALNQRAPSATKHAQRQAHFQALIDSDVIERETDPNALREAIKIADLLHEKPPRGQRAGTPYEAFINRVNNRIAKLGREPFLRELHNPSGHAFKKPEAEKPAAEKEPREFPDTEKMMALRLVRQIPGANKGEAKIKRGQLKALEKEYPGITAWAEGEHTKEQEAKRPKLIGKNKAGQNLYEDANGHRSIEEAPGILVGETVGIRLTQEGVVAELPPHKDEYKTAEELAAEKKPEAPGLKNREDLKSLGKRLVELDEEKKPESQTEDEFSRAVTDLSIMAVAKHFGIERKTGISVVQQIRDELAKYGFTGKAPVKELRDWYQEAYGKKEAPTPTDTERDAAKAEEKPEAPTEDIKNQPGSSEKDEEKRTPFRGSERQINQERNRIEKERKRLKTENDFAYEIAVNDKGHALREVEAEKKELELQYEDLRAAELIPMIRDGRVGVNSDGTIKGTQRPTLAKYVNQYDDVANLFTPEQLAKIRGEKPPGPKLEKPVEPEAKAEKLKVGDAVRVVDVDSILAKTETVDGVRHELFNANALRDKRAAVRVVDEDSGNVISLVQYPTYDQAEAEYKDVVAKARKMETPAPQQEEPKNAAEKLKENVEKRKEEQAPTEEKPAAERTPGEFEKGDRVVVAKEGINKKWLGRHGEVINKQVSNWTIHTYGGGPATSRNEREVWYDVKTDAGTVLHVRNDDIEAETEKPAGPVIPDIEIDGEFAFPENVLHLAGYHKGRAESLRASGIRARKADKKAEYAEAAKKADEKAKVAREAFEAWAKLYPEAAAEASEGKWKPAPEGTKAAAPIKEGKILTGPIEKKNPKTNATLFVVGLKSRVETAEYQRIKAIAEKHQGYWFNGRGVRGAVPGFTFNQKADAAAFMNEVEPETAEAVAEPVENLAANEVRPDRYSPYVYRLNDEGGWSYQHRQFGHADTGQWNAVKLADDFAQELYDKLKAKQAKPTTPTPAPTTKEPISDFGKRWDAMGYGEHEAIASKRWPNMRAVIHRLSTSRWENIDEGERKSLEQAYRELQETKPAATKETAAPETFARPKLPSNEPGFENMVNRQALFAQQFTAFLNTLPESTLQSPSALANKINHSSVADWASIDRDTIGVYLQYRNEDGSRGMRIDVGDMATLHNPRYIEGARTDTKALLVRIVTLAKEAEIKGDRRWYDVDLASQKKAAEAYKADKPLREVLEAKPEPPPPPRKITPQERIAGSDRLLERMAQNKAIRNAALNSDEENYLMEWEYQRRKELNNLLAENAISGALFDEMIMAPKDQGYRADATGTREEIRAQEKPSETKPAPAPTPTPAESPETAKARQDLEDALAELGQFALDSGFLTKKAVPPAIDSGKLLPILTKLVDAAFRLGYYKFKDAARYALDTIRERVSPALADAITLDHLQGAYIAMAGDHPGMGADTKKDVIAIESLDEIAKQPATPAEVSADIREQAKEAGRKAAEPLFGWASKVSTRAKVKTAIFDELFALAPDQAENDLLGLADELTQELIHDTDQPRPGEIGAPGAPRPGAENVPGTGGGGDTTDVLGGEGGGNAAGVRPGDIAAPDEAGQVEPRVSGEVSGANLGTTPDLGEHHGDVSGISPGRDYRIGNGELTREGSWLDTAKRNVDIIELVHRIESENRPATPEEQAQLVKFTGWGASDIRNRLFPTHAGVGDNYHPWAIYGEWKGLAERVKETFTADDWRTAMKATQYAHYTSEPVIRSIWSAMERLGFEGGSILEPGAGIGLFNGLMPDSIARNSKYVGIEMDGFSARIARLLFPSQAINPNDQGDFVKAKLPKSFFDAAVGNPPFQAKSKIPYNGMKLSLHDFFFVKTLDQLRAGGLMAFVTSRYTMDKVDSKVRDYLAKHADLLGAIRLPQTAFLANAGTEVVTDVIFLRKREVNQLPGGAAWKELKEVATDQGKAVNVNEYFADHPEMVLGKHSEQGTMYAAGEYTVLPNEGSIDEQFADAVKNLPVNVYSVLSPSVTKGTIRASAVEKDWNPKHRKEGGMYLSDDGKLMRVESGVGVPLESMVKLSDREAKWLKSYVQLRDALKEAQYDQLSDGDWQASLKRLQKVYAKFVKDHGNVLAYRNKERTEVDEDGNETTTTEAVYINNRLMRMDVEGTLMDGLEIIKDDGSIIKAPVLLDRVLKNPVTPKIETVHDALAVSLKETGRFDINDVARLNDMPPEQAIEALGDMVYEQPHGGWTLADEYLSGDVKTALEEARTAVEVDPKYQRNVDALLKVQPDPLGADQVTVGLGATWVPLKYFARFARDIIGIADAKIEFNPIAAEFSITSKQGPQKSRDASHTWGTENRSPIELLDAALNHRTLKVYTGAGTKDDPRMFDREASKQANEMADRMQEEFASWVWTDAERTHELLDIYNEKFNRLAPRYFNADFLDPPGLSLKFPLHSHQKRAIWRAVQTGNTYFAHAVGAGKTLEMIVSGMEQKRLGLINKPMYVVPNHMLNQFAREFLEAYPAAHIMVADEYNFHTDNRRRFIAQATFNAPDAIVLTHSAFNLLEMKPENIRNAFDDVLNDLRETLSEIPDDFENRRSRSQIEAQMERIERGLESKEARAKDKARAAIANYEKARDNLLAERAKAEEMRSKKTVERIDLQLADLEKSKEGLEAKAAKQRIEAAKNSAVYFEDLGVDFLFVDEAHQYRKLDYATKMQVKGLSPVGSAGALRLFVKTRWLDSQRPGRSFAFASGTPVTNTMAELFSVQRFFMEKQMRELGIINFDAWAAQFGRVATEYERNATGVMEAVNRFSKFVNVADLMALVRQFMDVLTMNELSGIATLPDVMEGNAGRRNIVVTPQIPELREYMEGELSRRLEASRAWKPSKDEPNNPDPVTNIITDGRLSAIDMRFIDPKLPSNPDSKLNKMIDAIIEDYHALSDSEYINPETKEPDAHKGGTQIVFASVGLGKMVAASRGFSAKEWIKKRLKEAKIPASEIAFMEDLKKSADKERTFKAMRHGKVRILIGTPKNMGTGVNVQTRLARLYHLDAPWYPADVEQPEGRILRQGNQNKQIAMSGFAADGTYDSTMWGMVARKAGFIEQAFSGDRSLRVMDDMSEAGAYSMAAAIASGDQRFIQLAQLEGELARIETKHAIWANQQWALERDIGHAKGALKNYRERLIVANAIVADIGDRRFYTATYDAKVGDVSLPKVTTTDLGREIVRAYADEWSDAVMAARAKALASDKQDKQGFGVTQWVKRTRQIGAIGDDIKIMATVETGAHRKIDENKVLTDEVGQAWQETHRIYITLNGRELWSEVSNEEPQRINQEYLGRKVNDVLNEAKGMPDRIKQKIAETNKELEGWQRRYGTPFPNAREQYEKTAELEALRRELMAEGKDVEVRAVSGWGDFRLESVIGGRRPATWAPRFSRPGKQGATYEIEGILSDAAGEIDLNFDARSSGRDAGALRGYSITRAEADRLGDAGAFVFRLSTKGPDTTGLQGWFLRENARHSYSLRRNYVTGGLAESDKGIYDLIDQIEAGRDLVEFARAPVSPEQPRAWATKLLVSIRRSGKSQPGGLYRRGANASSGVTKKQLQDSLIAKFGMGVNRLIEAGTLNIVQSVADLPEGIRAHARGDEEGAYWHGKAYVIADNVSEDRARAVLLHELGEHFGLKAMLGEKAYAELQGRINRLYRMGNARVREAWNEVLREYRDEKGNLLFPEGSEKHIAEVIARLGENDVFTKAQWWRALLARIKAFLLRHGFGRMVHSLTDADLNALLVASVRKAAKDAPRLYRGQASEIAGFARQFGVTAEQLKREFAAVRARYAGTDQWMKAPNGKPSRLNELQWVMVRTPRFTTWFGDWQNDPANASKVVDENGEPLVVYHGTNADIIEFKTGMPSAGHTEHTGKSTAHFLTDNPENASAWAIAGSARQDNGPIGKNEPYWLSGKTVYPVFVRMANPREYDAKGKRYNKVPLGNGPGALVEKAKKLKNDGVIIRNLIDPPVTGWGGPWDATQYVVFDATQIKSAIGNTGEFDAGNPDIRHARPADIFYSELAQQLGQVKATKAPGAQWKAIINGLKQKGVKADEIEWSGVLDWLSLAKGPVTREDVLAFVEGNGVRVDEVRKWTQGFDRGTAWKEIEQEILDDAKQYDFNDGLWWYETIKDQRDQIIEDIRKSETKHEDEDGDTYYELTYEGKTERVEEDYDDTDIDNAFGLDDKTVFGTIPEDQIEEGAQAILNESNAVISQRVDQMEEEFKLEREAKGIYDLTKYAKWQLPGGENYKELLITLPRESAYKVVPHPEIEGHFAIMQPNGGYRRNGPETVRPGAITDWETREYAEQGMRTYAKDQFRSSHFDEPNILAHIRFNERTDADGKRVLFLEEIQSDWGQEGKRKGFAQPEYSYAPDEWTGPKKESIGDETFYTYRHKSGEELEVSDRDIAKAGDLLNDPALLRTLATENFQDRELNGGRGAPKSIPRAPFVTDTKAWVSLALKRAIRYAAENGFERIAWTTGEQQAARYDLSKQVGFVSLDRTSGGFTVTAYKDDSATNEILSKTVKSEDEVADIIGKEPTEKLFKDMGNGNHGELRRADLKVGGEGMKVFYDAIVPQVANSLLKKFGGGKVETVGVSNGLSSVDPSTGMKIGKGIAVINQPGFDITPALKDRALQGLPLFHRVFHGSGVQNLNRFSLDYVGTGEGSGAFGYGLYFADERKVAEFYKITTGTLLIRDKDGKPYTGIEEWAVHFISPKPGVRKSAYEAKQDMRRVIHPDSQERIEFLAQADAAIDRLEHEAFTRAKGALYEVELAPEQDEYLDWDATLDQQSDKVKAKLGRLPDGVIRSGVETGEDVYNRLERKLGSAQEASLFLRDLGIPGAKYLDQSSRGGYGTTHNYVLYRPELAEIKAMFSRRTTSKTEGRAYTPEQEATIAKYDRNLGDTRSLYTRAKDRLSEARGKWATVVQQGMVDKYRSFLNILGDENLWMLAQLSHTAGGPVEAALSLGQPYRDASGAIDVDRSKPSVKQIIKPLGAELDDWLKWIAGNRAQAINVKADKAALTLATLKAEIKKMRVIYHRLLKGQRLDPLDPASKQRIRAVRGEIADLQKEVQDMMHGNITLEGRTRINQLNRLIEFKQTEIKLIHDPLTVAQRGKAIKTAATFIREAIAEAKAAKKRSEIRERFLKQADIDAFRSLNQGDMADGRNRAQVYDEARKQFEAVGAAIVDISVQTGTVSAEEADRWQTEGWYVPFYRFLEAEPGEKTYGPRGLDSLNNQTAYQKFKGADIPINDLLTNVVLNWHHLIDSALKNQAATKALEAAEGMGLAKPIKPIASKKGDIFVRQGGKKVYYRVDDSFEGRMVSQSLLAMHYQGLNNFAMKMANRFKRTLTYGVTFNPVFKVRNLLRDSVHAVIATQASPNILANWLNGWKGTASDSPVYAKMIASGGGFADSGYIQPGQLGREKILEDVDAEHLIDSRSKWTALFRHALHLYEDVGARSENINRAAEFQRRLDRGDSLLEAAFWARDQLDFSRHGAWAAVYELAHVVPFLNARLQGLDKLGRSMKDPRQRKQFLTMAGLYVTASVALYLAMKDDDDFKELEEWRKEAYHVFKLPGSEALFYIPRPFEIGALSSIIERITEQVVDKDAHGELFAERLGHILSDQLSMNPVPQIFMPTLEIMANRDYYTGRKIEATGMERLSATERKRAWTSQTAIAFSRGMDKVTWGKVVLSPVQVEHLVNGYLGWIGAATLASTDLLMRQAMGLPARPKQRAEDWFFTGNFLSQTPLRNTKFVTDFYDNLGEVQSAFADIKVLREQGEPERSQAVAAEHKTQLPHRKPYERAARRITEINNQIEKIEFSKQLTPEQKRGRIDQLTQERNRIAKRMVTKTSDVF